MGMWNDGPLDSDQALDWLGEHVIGPVKNAVKSACAEFDKLDPLTQAGDILISEVEHLRAAAWTVVRLDQLISPYDGFNVYSQLVNRLVLLSQSRYGQACGEVYLAENQKLIDGLRALAENYGYDSDG